MRISRYLGIEMNRVNRKTFLGLISLFLSFSCMSCAQPKVRTKDYVKQTSSYSQQGAAVYGKYLFQFTAGTVCDIYDLRRKRYVGQMSFEGSDQKHCDTACFGWLKVNEKDEFPVVYVSGSQIWENKEHGLIWVYRIIHKRNWWGLELLQVIETPQIEDIGICPDALLSEKDSTMWLMGWKTDLSKPLKDGSGAYLTFLKFKAPNINDGRLDNKGVRYTSLLMKDTLVSFDIQNAHIVQQGICLRNKMVYIPYGCSTDGYQGIDIVSLEEKRIVKNIDLIGTSVLEPEAVFFYKDEMYIADQATTIKKIVESKRR